MSVLSNLMFALVSGLAIGAMISSWRRYGPRVVALHDELRRPAPVEEIRLAVEEHVLVRRRSSRGLLRHMHRAKPVKHRLHGRSPRRAAA